LEIGFVTGIPIFEREMTMVFGVGLMVLVSYPSRLIVRESYCSREFMPKVAEPAPE